MDNATTQDATARAEAVAELMDANEWTREEAEAWLDDPANQTLCEDCGWTMGMVCPECAKGCGCVTNCSGWRHSEWRLANGLDEDEDPDDGCECGAYWSSNGYGCVCQ